MFLRRGRGRRLWPVRREHSNRALLRWQRLRGCHARKHDLLLGTGVVLPAREEACNLVKVALGRGELPRPSLILSPERFLSPLLLPVLLMLGTWLRLDSCWCRWRTQRVAHEDNWPVIYSIMFFLLLLQTMLVRIMRVVMPGTALVLMMMLGRNSTNVGTLYRITTR